MNYRLVFQFSSSFVLIGVFLLPPCLTTISRLPGLMGSFMNAIGVTDAKISAFAEKALDAIDNAQKFCEKHGTHWEAVQVGWPFYHNVPLKHENKTVKIHKSEFKEAENFCSGKDNRFRGVRFVDAKDPTIMLLYDRQGQLVGIQNGIRKEDYNPPQNLKNVVYVNDGKLWTRTAYFMDPMHICDASPKRNKPEEVADDVYIQNGETFKDTFILPRYERDLNQSIWTEGVAVGSLGRHHWHTTVEDPKHENFVPVFPLYSGWTSKSRHLMAFGWITDGDFSSAHYFHPTKYFVKNVMPNFMSEAPSFPNFSNIFVHLIKYPIIQSYGK